LPEHSHGSAFGAPEKADTLPRSPGVRQVGTTQRWLDLEVTMDPGRVSSIRRLDNTRSDVSGLYGGLVGECSVDNRALRPLGLDAR